MNLRQAFDDIIDLCEKNGYINRKYLRLDVLFEEFSTIVNGAMQEKDPACTIIMDIIRLITPGLWMGYQGRAIRDDLDLDIDELLFKNGYPYYDGADE